MNRTLLVGLLCAAFARLPAQSGGSAAQNAKPIQDNSFLLEEAYNQEAGVIQHISGLLFDRKISTWLYAFTDEWPVNGQRHQLSLTVPLQNAPADGSASLGDIALNYRLQLIGSGETRLAVTPRVTVLFPTASQELGGGMSGVQGALASSYMVTPTLALHTNIAFTTRSGAGRVSSRDVGAGQSAIWLVHPRLNLMLEGIVVRAEGANFFTLAPGLRWAYNFPSGLQIVPGLAFPIGFSANSGQRGVFLYLSFEHELPALRK